MSVSGMKKQLHKASQLLNERLMGAEGTKMDEDFLKMEKTVLMVQSLLAELLSRTTEFLQPNPASRARLNLLLRVSRLRGHGRSSSYPQTEALLGDCMLLYSQELGDASEFGGALWAVGEALQQVAQARDALDENVTSSFIEPLQEVHNTELKEIRFQLKKVSGRRLDFDYRRRRRGRRKEEEKEEEEVLQAWEKFCSSKELAERSMFLLLQNDADQLTRLSALVSSLLDFHRSSHHILLGLHGNLQARLTAASNRPERRYRPRKIRIRSDHFYQQPSITSTLSSGDEFTVFSDSPTSCQEEAQPCCRAIYSFHPDRPGELDFTEGDVIVLTGRVDSNWFEGKLGERTGLFPVSYVDVMVPLPLP